MRSAITQLSYFFFLSVAISFGISLSVCGLCVFFFFFDMFMFVCTIPFNSSSPPLSFYQSVYSIYSIYCRLKKKKKFVGLFFVFYPCLLPLSTYLHTAPYLQGSSEIQGHCFACLPCLSPHSLGCRQHFVSFLFPSPRHFCGREEQICTDRDLSIIYLSIYSPYPIPGGRGKQQKTKNKKRKIKIKKCCHHLQIYKGRKVQTQNTTEYHRDHPATLASQSTLLAVKTHARSGSHIS